MMRFIPFLVALLFAAHAYAVTIEAPLEDPDQERVARAAIAQLKCVVCEGQSLAESDARFARQMREEIRHLAGEGKSKADILAYFRSRYGAQILLNPPVESSTLLLWIAPFAMVIIGGLCIARITRRRQA